MQSRTKAATACKVASPRRRLPGFVVAVLSWLTINRLTGKNARVIRK